jgi:hypothetical protein
MLRVFVDLRRALERDLKFLNHFYSRNTKHEARNKSKILMLKCPKRNYLNSVICCFGHLDFENLNLFRPIL